jgi:hypothetical protein
LNTAGKTSTGVGAIAMAGIVLGTRHFLPNWLAAINIYALYAAEAIL